MSINTVQFQPGLSMAEFMTRYGTEAKCYRALYRWRWPQGFRCPACEERRRSRFRRDGAIYYQCRACRHRTTLTSGTLLANSNAAAAHLAAGDSPAERDQNQPGRAGVDAPPRRQLQDCVAAQAQDHAGDGRTRRYKETQGFRADRRCLPRRRT